MCLSSSGHVWKRNDLLPTCSHVKHSIPAVRTVKGGGKKRVLRSCKDEGTRLDQKMGYTYGLSVMAEKPASKKRKRRDREMVSKQTPSPVILVMLLQGSGYAFPLRSFFPQKVSVQIGPPSAEQVCQFTASSSPAP
jgi:hypothetical protein